PFPRGERTEVRGFRHSVSSNPHPTLSLEKEEATASDSGHGRVLVCASRKRVDSRCKVNRVGESLIAEKEVSMKSTALVPQPKFGSAASASLFALALLILSQIGVGPARNEPILVPDAVDYQKLLPILPEPPQGWV